MWKVSQQYSRLAWNETGKMQPADLLALLRQPPCSALDTAAAVAAHLGGGSSVMALLSYVGVLRGMADQQLNELDSSKNNEQFRQNNASEVYSCTCSRSACCSSTTTCIAFAERMAVQFISIVLPEILSVHLEMSSSFNCQNIWQWVIYKCTEHTLHTCVLTTFP